MSQDATQSDRSDDTGGPGCSALVQFESRHIDTNLEPLTRGAASSGYVSCPAIEDVSLYVAGSAAFSGDGRHGIETYADQFEVGADIDREIAGLACELETGIVDFPDIADDRRFMFRAQSECTRVIMPGLKVYAHGGVWVSFGSDPVEPYGGIGGTRLWQRGDLWQIGFDTAVSYDGLEHKTRALLAPLVVYRDTLTLSVGYLVGGRIERGAVGVFKYTF